VPIPRYPVGGSGPGGPEASCSSGYGARSTISGRRCNRIEWRMDLAQRSTREQIIRRHVDRDIAWAIWKVGFDGWGLVARVIALLVIGLPLLFRPIRSLGMSSVPATVWRAGLPSQAQ